MGSIPSFYLGLPLDIYRKLVNNLGWSEGEVSKEIGYMEEAMHFQLKKIP